MKYIKVLAKVPGIEKVFINIDYSFQNIDVKDNFLIISYCGIYHNNECPKSLVIFKVN